MSSGKISTSREDDSVGGSGSLRVRGNSLFCKQPSEHRQITANREAIDVQWIRCVVGVIKDRGGRFTGNTRPSQSCLWPVALRVATM